MAQKNVGFQRDLNLNEVSDVSRAINNLGGAGISNDLLVIRNNLRNISTTSYVSLSDGYFFFGSSNDFIFTDDDVVGVSTNVSVGSTTLFKDVDYYVCNSNAKNIFKLSTTPSSVGLTTIGVTTVTPTNFIFIRKDPVNQENLVNFAYPDIQDASSFEYSSAISTLFSDTTDDIEYSNYVIDKRYQKNVDINVTDLINIEGVVTIDDPNLLNISSANLTNPKSPGLFIGTSRAFSDTTSFWEKNITSSALVSLSTSVSMEELYFDNAIQITGISTESATGIGITTWTHKLSVIINDEPYYLLLRTT